MMSWKAILQSDNLMIVVVDELIVSTEAIPRWRLATTGRELSVERRYSGARATSKRIFSSLDQNHC